MDKQVKKASIKIDQIITAADVYQAKGRDRTYNVYQWYVSGTVDGKADKFVVKTFSDSIGKEFKAGWSGDAEVDEFKGKVKYILKKDRSQYQGGGRGGGQSQGDFTKGIEVGHAINNAVNIVSAFGPDRIEEWNNAGELMKTIRSWAEEIMLMAEDMKSGGYVGKGEDQIQNETPEDPPPFD